MKLRNKAEATEDYSNSEKWDKTACRIVYLEDGSTVERPHLTNTYLAKLIQRAKTETAHLTETTQIQETNLKTRNFAVEETSQEEIKKETAQWMEEQKKKNQAITINLVNSTKKTEQDKNESVEDEIKRLKEDNEDLTQKLLLVAEKEFERKKRELNAPSWIDSPETLMKWEKDQTKGGVGTVSLSTEQLRSERNSPMEDGFDSNEEMIDYLQNLKHNGNEEQRQYAKGVLDRFWQKTLLGMQEMNPKKLMTYAEHCDGNKSMIKRMLDRENEVARAKAKGEFP